MRVAPLPMLLFALVATPLRADFLSPFVDAEVGTTVTAEGVFVREEHARGAPDYWVRVRTDTGPKRIPAQIPPELMKQNLAGCAARITATIREREDPETKAKVRFLEVVAIEMLPDANSREG